MLREKPRRPRRTLRFLGLRPRGRAVCIVLALKTKFRAAGLCVKEQLARTVDPDENCSQEQRPLPLPECFLLRKSPHGQGE